MIAQSENGAAVSGAPLTTTVANQAVPGLLKNAIDERIVKIRPMATPIDQLSRCYGSRPCNSMKVDYYSVDVKATSAKLTKAVTGDDLNIVDGETRLTLSTTDNAIFSVSETVLIPSAKGAGDEPLVGYVASASRDGGVEIVWLNAAFGDDDAPAFGTIAVGAEVVRMGRAAKELDVQTAQYEALPKKRTNNCQIFKMQIEQSTLQKLANKEVGWTLSDQEEVAIIDMRQGMEKNFLFGHKAVYTDPAGGDEVYLTGGIWNQTDKTFVYKPSSMSAKTLVSMCRKAFTGNNGSGRKILIGGSGLIENLSNVEYNKVIESGKTMVRWGIEFKEIRSNFGSLYVLHSEIFDQCGHPNDGFILDPDFLTKYSHIPFHAETLNLRNSGQRNSDAVVLTEASCLVLRHPNAHMRVVANTNLSVG